MHADHEMPGSGRRSPLEKAGIDAAAQTGFPEDMETDPRLVRTTGHINNNWGIAGFYQLATYRFLEFVPELVG